MTSTLKWAKICPPSRGSLQVIEPNLFEILGIHYVWLSLEKAKAARIEK